MAKAAADDDFSGPGALGRNEAADFILRIPHHRVRSLRSGEEHATSSGQSPPNKLEKSPAKNTADRDHTREASNE
jgi:hypothetical protein